MRLTFVSSGLNTGGAEAFLLRLVAAMRRFDVESAVISLRSCGTIGPLLQAASVPTLCLGLPAPAAFLSALSHLDRHVREWRPDLLQGWMYHGNLAASVGAWRLGLPIVWGIRQSLADGVHDKWMTRRAIQAGAWLSPRAEAIVYPSATARQQHEKRGYSAEHGIVIPNGFDTALLRSDESRRIEMRAELGIEESAPVIAQVARYHSVKDYPTFLRAAARLAESLPRAVFVLVGEQIDSSNIELARLIAALNLGKRVRLLSRRSDIAGLMPGFDVLCLTSKSEAFPNVIGEAMSCGVPCVGTSVGDVAELIGDTGEVVPPGDAEAVAAAVGRVLALEPAARRTLGQRARQRIVDRYSIGEVARRYADLLHSVVARRR